MKDIISLDEISIIAQIITVIVSGLIMILALLDYKAYHHSLNQSGFATTVENISLLGGIIIGLLSYIFPFYSMIGISATPYSSKSALVVLAFEHVGYRILGTYLGLFAVFFAFAGVYEIMTDNDNIYNDQPLRVGHPKLFKGIIFAFIAIALLFGLLFSNANLRSNITKDTYTYRTNRIYHQHINKMRKRDIKEIKKHPTRINITNFKGYAYNRIAKK